jgi:hypothetical protein
MSFDLGLISWTRVSSLRHLSPYLGRSMPRWCTRCSEVLELSFNGFKIAKDRYKYVPLCTPWSDCCHWGTQLAVGGLLRGAYLVPQSPPSSVPPKGNSSQLIEILVASRPVSALNCSFFLVQFEPPVQLFQVYASRTSRRLGSQVSVTPSLLAPSEANHSKIPSQIPLTRRFSPLLVLT